jgi:transcriptional regulator with XRE-family HTH domain
MYEKKVKKILSKIKKRRVQLGYTQKHLADHLGISQNIYSKIELNNIKLTACRFMVICTVLEIDPADLLKI